MPIIAAFFSLCLIFLTASQYTKAIENVEYYYNFWDRPQDDSVYTNIEYGTSSFQSNFPIDVRDGADKYSLLSSSQSDYADSNENDGGIGRKAHVLGGGGGGGDGSDDRQVLRVPRAPGIGKKARRKIIRKLAPSLLKHLQKSISATIASANRHVLSTKLQAIFPGTLWCGAGNAAKSTESVGYFHQTDKCCREHDMCPWSIPAGQEKFGLHNGGMFTRSHCDCDYTFYTCLEKANTVISRKMAFTYFTVLGPQCFKEEYPVQKCKTRLLNRCVKYIVDGTKPKIWQWFDNKEYVYSSYFS